MKYEHTNIICKDLYKIVGFYVIVFKCKQIGKEGSLSGSWVDKGAGLQNVNMKTINLQLPGYGDDGPKLELFQYSDMVDREQEFPANRQGIRHLAFSVDNVEEVVNKAIDNGGKKLGEISEKEFSSGTLTFVYITDPEGNIIEVQKWTPM